MKNGYYWKIAVNQYLTESYPIALYRRKARWLSRWEHSLSFRTIDEAINYFYTMRDETKGLPIYL